MNFVVHDFFSFGTFLGTCPNENALDRVSYRHPWWVRAASYLSLVVVVVVVVVLGRFASRFAVVVPPPPRATRSGLAGISGFGPGFGRRSNGPNRYIRESRNEYKYNEINHKKITVEYLGSAENYNLQ